MDEIEKAYQEALDYLYSFIDYSLTRQFRYTPEKFNLGRMVALLDALGNPQQQYHVIHVAGTKGKGSVSAMIASALQAAGYRTGFYSSPHLIEFTERIQVDRAQISKASLVMLVREIKPFVEQIPQLTTFELTTALAFMHFARQNVQVAVAEVGLGGRLDATNVVTPLVSVITALSYDHQAVLGNTLTEIAGEKAGIIKPGRPVVVALQPEEALRKVEQVAAEKNAPLTLVGRDVFCEPGTHSLAGQSLRVWLKDASPVELSIPLLGQHQVENAATAYAALDVARREGLTISDDAIRAGFGAVTWHGRFEVLRADPPLIIDSAHNRDSARRLRQAIDDYLGDMPVILIFGASEDKDISGMFSELLPRAARLIATQSIHPRAAEAESLVRLAHSFDIPAQVVLPLEKALETALEQAKDSAAVVVAGSLFVAGAAWEVWQKMRENQETKHEI